MYRNIAKALDRNFWDPLYEQFLNINSSVRKLQIPRKSLYNNSVQRCNAEKKLELISSTVKLECTENLVTSLSIDGEVRSLPERPTSITKEQHDLQTNSSGCVNSKSEFETKREKYHHKITSAFFFASFTFIVLAIPTITSEIILFVYFRWTEFHWNLLYGALLCQFLFSLVFLINPFFYMLSSSFVIQNLTIYFERRVKKQKLQIDHQYNSSLEFYLKIITRCSSTDAIFLIKSIIKKRCLKFL